MKKLVTFAVAAVLLSACNGTPEYKITGTVSDTNLNGQYVYLYDNTSAGAEAKDSALVEKGKFTLKGSQDTPSLYILRFSNDVVEPQRVATGMNSPFTALFVLENAKYKAELSETSTVTGTPENDAYSALQADFNRIYADSEKIMNDMRSDDPEIAKAAETRYDNMTTAISNSVKEYIHNNSDSQTAAKLLYDFRHNINEKERRDIIAKAGDTFKATPGIDKIIEHLDILDKVAVGKKFTDFEMMGADGKMHKLSDYVGNGKIVLIDFWASWCPPCRADMPHLVQVYKQYRNKDFEIVGISLDRTDDAWKKGIKDLNITWPQMSDLKFWQSEGAALYGVNSIPHTVLIDKDGVIIDKNLRGDALETKLKEIL